MSDRYLRHKEDGFIYHWNEILAVHPKLEEVTEQVAFPERFATPKVRARTGLSGGPRKPAGRVDLSTEELEEAFDDSHLQADLKKGLP